MKSSWENRLWLAWVVACGLALMTAGLSRGQNATARIVGNVTDPNGGAVQNAKVTVVNTATQVHYDTATNNEGYYEALNLPIGSSSTCICKEGFCVAYTYLKFTSKPGCLIRCAMRLPTSSNGSSI